MENDINKELTFQRFIQREYELSHPTYDSELTFYQLVQSGNTDALLDLKNSNKLKDINIPERGILSDNPISNLKYHVIVTIAMISRFCIEGGLDERMSYGLSDIYINRVDKAASIEHLLEIHCELIFDYANRMKKVNSAKSLSIHCIKVMDYISDNLHKPLTVQDIASHLSLDRTYLSKLFKKETNQNISEYIRCKKIQTAQNMLLYSNFTCSEIAQYLAFASHSHFSDVFKKYTKMTPSEYKQTFYRKHWQNTKKYKSK